MKSVAALILLSLALLPPVAARAGNSGDFDYYVLSLSWSPTWCASEPGRARDAQCAAGRRYERGWPQYCDSAERWVPRTAIAAMLDIMPSKRLIIHEWRKHGSCSGLSQKDYFAALRRFFVSLHIPARYLAPTRTVTVTAAGLVSDFVKSNAGLEASMLSLDCGNARDTARLSELRVCFSRNGHFRACGANERHGCAARLLNLPPVR